MKAIYSPPHTGGNAWQARRTYQLHGLTTTAASPMTRCQLVNTAASEEPCSARSIQFVPIASDLHATHQPNAYLCGLLAIITARSGLLRLGSEGPSKLYPQSQRVAPGGFVSPQVGQSFGAVLIWPSSAPPTPLAAPRATASAPTRCPSHSSASA